MADERDEFGLTRQQNDRFASLWHNREHTDTAERDWFRKILPAAELARLDKAGTIKLADEIYDLIWRRGDEYGDRMTQELRDQAISQVSEPPQAASDSAGSAHE